MKREYLGQLTGIRIFLTLIVVLSNMALFHDVDPGLILNLDWKFFNILASAPVRVDIFFMLTGFLLFYIYSPQFTKNISKKDYINFLTRRIARIYPVHFLILILIGLLFCLGIWGDLDDHGSVKRILEPINWFLNSTMMHAWGWGKELSAFNGPSWSISIELINYIVFPIIVLLMTQLKKTWHYILVFFAILSLYQCVQLTFIKDIGVYYGPGAILRGIVGMVLGISIAQLFLSARWRSFIWDYVFLALILMMAIMMIYSLSIDDKYDYLFYIPLPFLILSLAFSTGIVRKFLSLPILIYLGNLSFSIYMIHQPFLRVAEYFFGSYYQYLVYEYLSYQKDSWEILLQLSFLLMGMIITAHFIYKYIETPARSWIKHKYPKQASQK